jgi:hypothetical protein
MGHEAEVRSPWDIGEARAGGITPPHVHVVRLENRTLSWDRSPDLQGRFGGHKKLRGDFIMAVVEAKQDKLVYHWAGVDVAKDTFDAALVLGGQRYPQTPLGQVPARRFARTEQGVAAFVAWLDELIGKKDAVRVCMEADVLREPVLRDFQWIENLVAQEFAGSYGLQRRFLSHRVRLWRNRSIVDGVSP